MPPSAQSIFSTLLPLMKLPSVVCTQSLVCSQSQATTELSASSLGSFTLSKNSYKWNHIVGSLFCLASLLELDAFEIHPCCSTYQ